MKMKALIQTKDYEGIKQLLKSNPSLANDGIPFDEKNTSKAHPLHRICDAVFSKIITDLEAIEIAKILLDFGANIDGDKMKENNDTPLIAAASLHAEQLGIFYIQNGADIHYVGCQDGATALHWAAFCGRDKLVAKLIEEKATIDQPDTSYHANPLGWAIQPLLSQDENNIYHQVSCIKLLLGAGANITALKNDSIQYLQLLAKEDSELKKLLN